MAKSFKRAIACMLAVLMVAFAAPISAFAQDVADYHPDIDVVFGTYYDIDSGDYNNVGNPTAAFDGGMAGIYDAPLTATRSVDTTTGALKVTKLELLDSVLANYDADLVGSGKVYGEGDYITLTILLKKVTEVNAFSIAMSYSNNIEPAGCYSYKSGKKTLYAVGTESERAAKSGTWVNGGTTLITEGSADGVYADGDYTPINNGVAADNDCYIDNTNKYMFLQLFTGSDGVTGANVKKTGAPVSSPDPEVPFINPVTGEPDYTYDSIIVASYAFKITGEISTANPLVLGVYDPTDTMGAYRGGCYTAELGYTFNLATYAENTQSPASKQMTYFGYNVNVGGEETFTFDSFTWDTSAEPYTAVANLVGNKGSKDTADATVTVATKTAATCGADEVVTYTATYGEKTESKDVTHTGTATGAHTWVADGEANPAATCTTAGSQAYVCSVCGATKTEVINALGHDMAYTAAKAPTCIADGNVAYYYCSRCEKYFADEDGNTELSSIVDPATGVHAWGDWSQNDASTHIRTCANGGETETEAHVAADAVDEAGVVPTATEDGYHYSVVYCSVCGYEISRETVVDPALGEDFTFQNFVIDTDAQTAIAVFKGDVTGTVDNRAAELDVQKTDATCLEDGETVYTASYAGVTATAENGGIVTVAIPAIGHELGEWTETTAAVPATCTEAGATAIETRTCSRCDYSENRGGEVIEALGHDLTAYEAVPATCTEDGTEAYWVCETCHKMFSDADANNEISNPITVEALGHAWGDWTVTKEATISKGGEETRTCSRCGETETRTTESLDINVTVANVEGGTVSGDIAVGETKTYKFGDSFTLTAAAATGYTFQGWAINGKSVSTATTYNGKAFADVTIEPIFAKNETESFTVVFYDLYKTVVSEQTVSSAAEIVVPTDESMARQGYTFKGWDKDPATVTGAAEIVGQYDVNKDLGYTVTITGADAVETTINGESVKSMDGIKYDSQVTVYAEGATGWKIGDTVVSTNAKYSFYVGSDVTVEAIFDAVELEPAIRIVNVAPVEGSYRYMFVATRVVPAGWTVEKVGFIYGKNLDDDELVLENANKTSAAGTKIKVGYNNVTPVLETSLQYGLSGRSGTIKAKAFMIVSKGSTKEIKYSQLMGYDYSIDTIIDGEE